MKIPILQNSGKLSSGVIDSDIARTSDMGADNQTQDNNISNLKSVVDSYVLPTSFATRLKGTLQAGSGISITSIDDNCTVSANLSASNKVFEIVQDNLALASADNSILYLVTGFDTSEPIGIWAYIGASDGDPSDSSLWIHADDLSGDFSNYSTTSEMNSAISFALANQLGDLETNSNLDVVLTSKGYAIVNDVNNSLALKADQATTYTKNETDTAINSAVSSKANSVDVYTKSVIDSLLADKSDVGASYIKSEEDSLLSAKADVISVYTQAQVDVAISNAVSTALSSLSNNSAHVKIYFDGLSNVGFSAGVGVIFNLRDAAPTVSPLTVWSKSAISAGTNTYDTGFFIQGSDSTADRIRENAIGQETRWRVSGQYSNKDSGAMGEMRGYLVNPSSNFKVSYGKSLLAGDTDGDFTMEFTSIADANSLGAGAGYQLGFVTSFDDENLTITVSSIVRFDEAMEITVGA